MSSKLAGFSSSTSEALQEVNSPALPSAAGNNTTAMNNGSEGLTASVLGGAVHQCIVQQVSSEYFHQLSVECSFQRFS